MIQARDTAPGPVKRQLRKRAGGGNDNDSSDQPQSLADLNMRWDRPSLPVCAVVAV